MDRRKVTGDSPKETGKDRESQKEAGRTPGRKKFTGRYSQTQEQKKKSNMKNKWEGPDKDYIKIPWKFIEAVYK